MCKTRYQIFFYLFFIFSEGLYAQVNACIDVNNRIRYSFPLQGTLFVKPVSPVTNFLLGQYHDQNDSGVIVAKTYLDNIVWAKKYNTVMRLFTMATPYLLPDGSVILNNFTYAGNNFYISHLSANGNVLWAKKFDILNGGSVTSNNQTTNPLVIYDDAIFLTANYQSGNTNYKVIAKIDFNGVILWSKGFVSIDPRVVYLNDPPNVVGDTIMITSNVSYYNSNGYSIDSIGAIITKLNAINGTVISNYKLKTVPDNFIKGITVVNSKMYPGNIISLTGVIGINFNTYPYGIGPNTGIPFILTLDKNLNTSNGKYFTYSSSHGLLALPEFKSYINEKKQTGLLLTDGYDKLGYSVIVDSNVNILRGRVFHPQSSNFFLDNSYYLDRNETVFYSFPYNPSLHQTDLEYSRINNLAPVNTLDCFGRDTSVLQPHIFYTAKDTFKWDNEYSNLLIATPFVVTEQPFTINQQTICTQTSICDTIKIKGNSTYCLSNLAATFTLYKNPQCLRKTKWIIDTSVIKIISQPDDNTVTVKFIKPFHGNIRAGFEGCALQDSLYIDVYAAKQSVLLGNDTTYCPGKTITLNAGRGFKKYKWQNSSTDSLFIATGPGVYFVQAIDSCDNVSTDTINIILQNQTLDLLYPTPLCLYDTATVALNSGLNSYLWSPPGEGSKQNNVLKLFPHNTTTFKISAVTSTGCTLFDTLLINVINCPEYIYIPNAFSPNNDGKNEIFKPSVSGRIEQYQFCIYNRFGQKIFNSTDINKGWDGKIKGIFQDQGVFIWTCSYKFLNKDLVVKKGTVMLIR